MTRCDDGVADDCLAPAVTLAQLSARVTERLQDIRAKLEKKLEELATSGAARQKLLQRRPDGSLTPGSEARLLGSPARAMLRGLGPAKDAALRELLCEGLAGLKLEETGVGDGEGTDKAAAAAAAAAAVESTLMAARIKAGGPLVQDLLLKLNKEASKQNQMGPDVK